MSADDPTRWSVIHEAAAGGDEARATFARHYLPVVRAYLGARWRGKAWIEWLDDAAQEVFVACFREDGVLQRAAPEQGGFRAYLLGAVRNIARQFERDHRRDRLRAAGPSTLEAAMPPDDEVPARRFDRAWAHAVMREAAARMRQTARQGDDQALERIEVLRLRFQEGQPIRAIAARLDRDPTAVHRAYARARREFQRALREVVTAHEGGSEEAVAAECRRLLTLLG